MDKRKILEANRKLNISLYNEYNKTIRTWLVGYGIAIPAIFITSKDAREYLSSIPDFKSIIAIFLMGVACQIFISLFNKVISWSTYHRDDCELGIDRKCHGLYLWFARWENEFWLDILFDLLSIGLFAWAVWHLLFPGKIS